MSVGPAASTDDTKSVCSDTMSYTDGEVDSPDDFECLFDKETVLDAPGIKAGLTPEQELRRRQLCAQLLQEMGVRMNVSQTVVNVAVLLMHRVFMFFPAHEEDAFLVAAACFAIACKTEDSQRKLQYIIDIFYRLMSGKRLLQQNASLGLDNANIRAIYDTLVNHYLNCEALVLTANGFDVNTDLPHGHLIRTCRELKLSTHASQTSYFLCTQLLHVTTLCLRYTAKSLAFACVQLAMTWSRTHDPRMCEKDPRPWYTQLDHRVQAHQVEEILVEFTSVWKQTAAKHKRHIMNLNNEVSLKMQQVKQEKRRLAVQRGGTPLRNPHLDRLDKEEGELSDHSSRASTPVNSHQSSNPKLSLQDYYNKKKEAAAATANQDLPPNKKPRIDAGQNHQQQQQQRHRQHHHHHYPHQHHRTSSDYQRRPGGQGGYPRSAGAPGGSGRPHYQTQHHYRSGLSQPSTQLGSGYNRRPTPQVGATPPALQPPLPPPPPPPKRGV